jgi:tRNA(fMet)-specific endonuclease VapC
MIGFLLDTDMLSLLQMGHPQVLANVNRRSRTGIALCTIVLDEQMRGWQASLLRARDSKQLADAHERLVHRLLPSWVLFAVLPFSEQAIVVFDNLKAMRLSIGSNDLRIASIALEQGITVVTRNSRDFGRVPGLTIVDWSV